MVERQRPKLHVVRFAALRGLLPYIFRLSAKLFGVQPAVLELCMSNSDATSHSRQQYYRRRTVLLSAPYAVGQMGRSVSFERACRGCSIFYLDVRDFPYTPDVVTTFGCNLLL